MVQQTQQKDNLSASGQQENSYKIFQAFGNIQEWLHIFNREELKSVISSVAYMLEWLMAVVLAELMFSVCHFKPFFFKS